MYIKEIRKQKGYSQATLAKQLNVNQTAVSQWERGVNLPRLDKVRELAKLLDCTIDELFTDVSTMDT